MVLGGSGSGIGSAGLGAWWERGITKPRHRGGFDSNEAPQDHGVMAGHVWAAEATPFSSNGGIHQPPRRHPTPLPLPKNWWL